jgi:hypothetical protein
VDWLGWFLRGLMAVGGAVVVWQGWPVALSSWHAQRADTVVRELRSGHPLNSSQVTAGIAALDRAVAVDPSAGRYLQRGEFLGGVASASELKISPDERDDLLRRANADFESGLAGAPARGADWLRLAVVRQRLDGGAARDVLPPLFMSIKTAPLITYIWPTRLRIILDNWAYFSEEQRVQLRSYVMMTWRLTDDRRSFGWAVRDPVDELVLRYFLHNEPKAQEELAKWILATRK